MSLCGNGQRDAGEQCDDGGTVAGDGCSELCRYEQLVPGKGSPATDCLAEWAVVNPGNLPYLDRKGLPSFKQRCVDGDSRCDADGTVDDACRFRVAVCLRNTDGNLPLCGAYPPVGSYALLKPRPDDHLPVTAANAATLLAGFARLGSATAGGPHANVLTFAVPLAVTAPDNCTTLAEVIVPLHGKRGSLTLKGRAATSTPFTSGTKDTDVLRLTCERP